MTLFKKSKRLSLAIFTIVLFFSGVIFVYRHKLYEIVTQKQSEHSSSQVLSLINTQKDTEVSPLKLKIPKINVDSVIEHVGLTSNGEMDVPKDTANVGWFHLGPRPGEMGSAVIAGHNTSIDGEAAVFVHLGELEIGDNIYTEDSNGETKSFIVQKIQMYDPGYADDVFRQDKIAHLNLITCDGQWDTLTQSYSKRLVVFADIAD